MFSCEIELTIFPLTTGLLKVTLADLLTPPLGMWHQLSALLIALIVRPTCDGDR